MSSRRPTIDSRRSEFKNQGLTQDEFRRRREENSVELRKLKKEDTLNKRRNLTNVQASSTLNDEDISSYSVDSNGSPEIHGAIDLQKAAHLIYSDVIEEQLLAITEFRKKLSKEKNPPIAEVLQFNVTPRFVELLMGTNLPPEDPITVKIQFEAAWALTNIASGNPEQTQHVVNLGTIPIFIQFLQHPNTELRDQCIWALGNIAGDCPAMRDMVLSNNIMYPLLTNINSELDSTFPVISIIRNATWTLSNLCRGKPSPNWNEVVVALPTLARLITVDDSETLADACWTLSYLSDVPPDHIERLNDIINANVILSLVRLTSYRNGTVQTPALRALGNIVTGNEMQTQVVIDAGGLPAMRNLLNDPRVSLQKEACWAISNITAGTVEQIQMVIDADIFPKIIYMLAYSDLKVKKEACWALCNATSMFKERPEQVDYLVKMDCIKPLCDVLNCPDVKTTLVALGGINNILEVGEMKAALSENGVNPYALKIEECNGLDTITNLQNHSNEKIYMEAKEIIDRFFDGDDGYDFEDETNPISYDVPSTGFNF